MALVKMQLSPYQVDIFNEVENGDKNIVINAVAGSGKTTTIGKLSNLLRKKHSKKPLLVACDVYRPAAIDQLKQIGKQLNIEVYEEGKKDPVEISKNAINYAKENNLDVDYFLTIESGITNLLGDYIIINVALISDKAGNIRLLRDANYRFINY